MITVSEIIGALFGIMIVLGMAVLGYVCFKREQERLLEESKARVEMYNAITDLCESWIENNGT